MGSAAFLGGSAGREGSASWGAAAVCGAQHLGRAQHFGGLQHLRGLQQFVGLSILGGLRILGGAAAFWGPQHRCCPPSSSHSPNICLTREFPPHSRGLRRCGKRGSLQHSQTLENPWRESREPPARPGTEVTVPRTGTRTLCRVPSPRAPRAVLEARAPGATSPMSPVSPGVPRCHRDAWPPRPPPLPAPPNALIRRLIPVNSRFPSIPARALKLLAETPRSNA